jgi:hypothetical protein
MADIYAQIPHMVFINITFISLYIFNKKIILLQIMSKFICEKCNKIFNKKSHYRLHINKTNGCVVEDEYDDNYDIIYNNMNVKNKILTKIPITIPILKNTRENIDFTNKVLLEHPIEINNYHGININNEILFLNLLAYIKNDIITVHGNINIYNLINSPIINVYINIQKNHNYLYNYIQEYVKESNENQKDKYYDWLYNEYCELIDKSSLEASAMYIFLNKQEETIKKEQLEELHNLTKNVKFINTELNNIQPYDFIYSNEDNNIDLSLLNDNKFIITCEDTKQIRKKFNNFKINSIIPKQTLMIKK